MIEPMHHPTLWQLALGRSLRADPFLNRWRTICHASRNRMPTNWLVHDEPLGFLMQHHGSHGSEIEVRMCGVVHGVIARE